MLVVLTPVWAGCISAQEDLPLTPLSSLVGNADVTYTWPAPVAYDGVGQELPFGLVAGEGELPRIVQTRLGTIGFNPRIVASEVTGAVFLTRHDPRLYFWDPLQLETEYDDLYRSTDSGVTWARVHRFVPPNYPESYNFYLSTGFTTWIDPSTDRTFASHTHPRGLCTYTIWSDDGGDPGSWQERPLSCNTPFPSIWWRIVTASPGPQSVAMPPTLYPNVLYLCSTRIIEPLVLMGGTLADALTGVTCAVSLDGGVTYVHEQQVHPNEWGCHFLPSQPVAFPDGSVAFALGAIGSRCDHTPLVYLSEDNGITWSRRQCPALEKQMEVEPSLAVTPDGTAYLLYREADHSMRLARSVDKFITCDTFRVSPLDHTMNAYAAIVAGSDGRIAMAYLGTRSAQGDKNLSPGTAAGGSEWHLFVTTSVDAGAVNPAFITQQVTPAEDPVQLGCIWLDGWPAALENRWPMCHNLGYHFSVARDGEGRFFIAFVDGCTPRVGCSGDPYEADFQTRDMELSVAILDSGVSLLEKKGILRSLGLEHPKPYVR